MSLFSRSTREIDLFKALLRLQFVLTSLRLMVSSLLISLVMVKLKSLLDLVFLQTTRSGVSIYFLGVGDFSSLFFTPKYRNIIRLLMKQKSYVVELKKLARIDRKPSHLSAHWVGHMPPLPFLNPIFGLNYSKII